MSRTNYYTMGGAGKGDPRMSVAGDHNLAHRITGAHRKRSILSNIKGAVRTLTSNLSHSHSSSANSSDGDGKGAAAAAAGASDSSEGGAKGGEGADRAHAQNLLVGNRRDSMRAPSTDTSTRFQKLVTGFRGCIAEMSDVVPPDSDLETWSCLIYESMCAPSRTFHSVQHVFDISAGSTDPVEIIGAFFHDVVYYHVDGGLTPGQGKMLDGVSRAEDVDDGKGGIVKKVFLREIAETDDRAMCLVMAVFGFEGGQELNPFAGLNEFLSAALACRCLEETVPLKRIAEISACIEMTIPFRKPKDGKDPAQLLYERLLTVNDSFKLEFTNDDLVAATKRAVDMANRDVGNFATEDPAHFLSNTWNLLPESNITLRHTSAFRISNFTLALKKMEGFFSFLDPGVIYVAFQGSPSDEALQDLTNRARHNLAAALKYMRCKLLSISVLAALAELTGGDAPVAMFLGDLPEPDYISPSIEDFIVAPPFRETQAARAAEKRQHESDSSLVEEGKATESGDGDDESSPQNKQAPPTNAIDESVYNLLRVGRDADTSFDLKHSPLAAYLYGLMGDDGLEASLEYAVYPMTEDGARKVLGCIPSEAVRKIATACAGIALTRAGKLRDIANDYKD